MQCHGKFGLDLRVLTKYNAKYTTHIKDSSEMEWDTFFDPKDIDLDQPHDAVIEMARFLHASGHMIVIFSSKSLS